MHGDYGLQGSDTAWQWGAPLQPRSGGEQAPYDGTGEASARIVRTARVGSAPRLLLLDEDSAMVEALSRALRSSVPRLSIDTCLAPDEARRRLITSPWHAIICSPTITVAGGNSILTCSRRVDPPVPFLLTLRPDERAFASQWLDLGVYDFVLSPFQPSQVRESVEDALLLSKRRALIERKQQVLIYLRQRRERSHETALETPLRHQVEKLLRKSILRIQESAVALEQMATRMEVSLNRLQRACKDNELHARQRALDKLKAELAD
jgi:response regulator RpfG family c-di-GMP phosphodiesterase